MFGDSLWRDPDCLHPERSEAHRGKPYSEYVVQVTGKVVRRLAGLENPAKYSVEI